LGKKRRRRWKMRMRQRRSVDKLATTAVTVMALVPSKTGSKRAFEKPWHCLLGPGSKSL
jgi:hypothetical protein